MPVHGHRAHLVNAVGLALVAGAFVACIDLALAASRGASGWALSGLVLALYVPPSIGLGVITGIVAAALEATLGPAWWTRGWRRVAQDPRADRDAAALVLTLACTGCAYALFAKAMALALVAGVERKVAGASLLGLALAAALPFAALLSVVVYRAMRVVATVIPRPGTLSVTAMVVISGCTAVGVLVGHTVVTRLEWRALNLPMLGFFTALPVAMGVFGGLASRLRARLLRRFPRGDASIALAMCVALAWVGVAFARSPDPRARVLLAQRTTGAAGWLRLARGFVDRDHDGYSGFLGGPDCDDGNAKVNPDPHTREIAGNGLDDNCVGGDRPLQDTESTGDPASPSPVRPGFRSPRNLLFLLIDSVRADRMGYTGFRRGGASLTPALDELAARSVVWTRAYAQASNTPRSIPSLFTSRYPSQIAMHARYHDFPALLDSNTTVFEALRAAGLHVGGISSHFYFTPSRNLAQGFDEYDNTGALEIAESRLDVAAPRIVPRVTRKLRELARTGSRFAMFVHLFEPHAAYVTQPGDAPRPDDVAAPVHAYEQELRRCDAWVGTLLAGLTESGVASETMVVVTSDHGEAFGAHRFAGTDTHFHGQTLYDEVLRVPVIVHVPGLAHRAIDEVTMLLDVAPTILDAMDIPRPEAFVGHSVLPRMLGESVPRRAAFAELLPAPRWHHAMRAMVTPDARHKLIHVASDARFELYDLKADPNERHDVWHERRDVAADLESHLVRWIEVDLPGRVD